MSLHPQSIPPVPDETVRVARAAFPKGNIYLKIRDTLGSIYEDSDFADLFSVKGQPSDFLNLTAPLALLVVDAPVLKPNQEG